MNKLFIDNESYDIEEDNITISQIKRKIYVNGKLISETNKDSILPTTQKTIYSYCVQIVTA